MTLEQTLKQAINIFSVNNIEDPHLEARVLLEHLLNLSAAELYTELGQNLSREQEENFHRLVERRLHREPTAYIVNRKEFYGIDFYVDQRVLIPRPETELLVEEALKFAKSQIDNAVFGEKPLLIADIGTGCGNIAISLALNLTKIKVYAVDISPSALEVTSLNCKYHKITEQVSILHGNLLEPIAEHIDLIVANLPYIKSSELPSLSPEISHYEPRIALDGGQEGLDQISQLLKQTKDKIRQQCCLLLEIGKGQEHPVVALINQYLPNARVELISDSNGIKRVSKIRI